MRGWDFAAAGEARFPFPRSAVVNASPVLEGRVSLLPNRVFLTGVWHREPSRVFMEYRTEGGEIKAKGSTEPAQIVPLHGEIQLLFSSRVQGSGEETPRGPGATLPWLPSLSCQPQLAGWCQAASGRPCSVCSGCCGGAILLGGSLTLSPSDCCLGCGGRKDSLPSET